MATHGPGPRPAGNLGWALGTVLRRWNGEVDHVLAGLPQGPRGFQVLGAVVHADIPTQAALAAHLGIDRTVMTYLIDELVDAGLVERKPSPEDRRVRRIVATAQGREALAEAERQVAAVEEAVLGGLTPEQRALFQNLTYEAACLIHELDPVPDSCRTVSEALR
ncbi:MarR family winged helix-turn-helix transcriptional regulator [Amycolatopsis rhabdoformis]|uniref:MarR family winged helix-turn-helix transcriptional regulator n=1 Tax=Amycolatopsis rhabdoformis TaxID=1448059 RepID=A0ABZ1HXG6_9PSEU|nr:MarR family winged helix-turn-helix transcriptional regulator [Amycolatopsis rhabdoformis]WSE26544.1 MarR family winged helix-turn-helix transcriptional regulator [Amycolatopsis rhabdoformis]